MHCFITYKSETYFYQGKVEENTYGATINKRLVATNPFEKNNFLLWIYQNIEDDNIFNEEKYPKELVQEISEYVIELDEFELMHCHLLDFLDLGTLDFKFCPYTYDKTNDSFIIQGSDFQIHLPKELEDEFCYFDEEEQSVSIKNNELPIVFMSSTQIEKNHQLLNKHFNEIFKIFKNHGIDIDSITGLIEITGVNNL